jgi:LytR cell envelope-related transcriptional attenuator
VGRGGEFPFVRALIVIAVFVAATVLLLGAVHPKTVTSASGASTTSTTNPAHPASTTTTVPSSKVPVLVANASAVPGAAAAVSNQLQPGGWNLLPPVNATARVATSHVYYVAGFVAQANAVAGQLHLPASAISPSTTADPITTIGTAEVLVVVGPDLATKAAPSATTTTVN